MQDASQLSLRILDGTIGKSHGCFEPNFPTIKIEKVRARVYSASLLSFRFCSEAKLRLTVA
ncbi:MAG: hypothetical protein SVX43_13095 [Cyanobacteriota bacterium]|nr:hypothetical protein [Cyanobacteriota bacterium]